VTVVLGTRADINLEAYTRVAWGDEDVAVAEPALAQVSRRRAELLELVGADPQRRFYGVNVHAGDWSNRVMTEEEQRSYERGLHSSTSFGEALPRRVVRGMVLARLANFIEGHAGVSPEVVGAVAARLDGRALPPVPRYGNGGPGEIQALGWLFGDIPDEVSLGIKEGMALINGSPCAGALVADAVLCSALVVELATSVFALACAADGVPDVTFDARLEALWGDAFDAQALQELRELLEGHDALPGDEHVQPAVSFRILPRVLGRAHRALAAGREVADVGLSAVSDNPVFLFADGGAADLVSNGGFHNGAAPGSIDALAFALADLAQLAQHQIQRLQTSERALPGLDSLALGTMQMVGAGYAEEARGACVPSLLPLAGFGQNDVPAPSFHAWNRFDRVRGFVVGSLTCLVALAAQALARPGRAAPPPLVGLMGTVLSVCPPIVERRSLGPELERLAAVLGGGVPA
jgi:histidine ammonia-lyase